MSERFSHVGLVIRWRRSQLGLTQDELCVRMGFPPERISYISAVENGLTADMQISRLDLFASALSFPAWKLLSLVNQESVAQV